MSNSDVKPIYCPHSYRFFAVLIVILLVVIGLVFFGVITLAFADVGFNPLMIVLILVGTLLGSFINIPLFKLKQNVPMVKDEFASFFGVTYRIPRVEYTHQATTIAINVGGALIPAAVSIYLLYASSTSIALKSLVGILVVALITRLLARPVKGVGIVMPAFIPPIAAALMAFLLSPGSPVTVAYVSGVLGTLIGADLLNLNRISKLGAPIASIGGAGTFDGVFLSGVIAVLIAALVAL